ncbi:MAG: hypothetical protein WC381_02100 [Kiritimatiellia bacterium]
MIATPRLAMTESAQGRQRNGLAAFILQPVHNGHFIPAPGQGDIHRLPHTVQRARSLERTNAAGDSTNKS